MKIGITGSRVGMSFRQGVSFKHWLDSQSRITKITEFHHGDCVGVDVQAVTFVESLYPEIETHSHPPINQSLRAFHKSKVIHPEKEYLDRNKDIVNSVDVMVCFPDGPEKLRSGTWSTIRYAKKVLKNVLVFDKDGQIVR